MYPPVSSWVQSTRSHTSPELGIQSVRVNVALVSLILVKTASRSSVQRAASVVVLCSTPWR
eukprot:186984-Rhodomonas_salina.1